MAEKKKVHRVTQNNGRKAKPAAKRPQKKENQEKNLRRLLPQATEKRLHHTLGSDTIQELHRKRIIQANLQVSAPGDAGEIEADSVASRVMSMSDKDLNHMPDSRTRDVPKANRINRKPQIKQRVSGNAGVGSTKAPNSVLNAVANSGKELPTSERQFFEPRFGEDLSHVRIHDGDSAAQAADTIQARAYTLGNSIVFNKGEYKPGTHTGRTLLAHEITHTFQQGKGSQRISRSAIEGAPIQRKAKGGDKSSFLGSLRKFSGVKNVAALGQSTLVSFGETALGLFGAQRILRLGESRGLLTKTAGPNGTTIYTPNSSNGAAVKLGMLQALGESRVILNRDGTAQVELSKSGASGSKIQRKMIQRAIALPILGGLAAAAQFLYWCAVVLIIALILLGIVALLMELYENPPVLPGTTDSPGTKERPVPKDSPAPDKKTDPKESPGKEPMPYVPPPVPRPKDGCDCCPIDIKLHTRRAHDSANLLGHEWSIYVTTDYSALNKVQGGTSAARDCQTKVELTKHVDHPDLLGLRENQVEYPTSSPIVERGDKHYKADYTQLVNTKSIICGNKLIREIKYENTIPKRVEKDSKMRPLTHAQHLEWQFSVHSSQQSKTSFCDTKQLNFAVIQNLNVGGGDTVVHKLLAFPGKSSKWK